MPLWEEKLRNELCDYGESNAKAITEEGTFHVKIKQSMDYENPRTLWDNAGKFLFHHKRYNLGDEDLWKELGINTNDFGSWTEIEEHLIKNCDAAITAQVRMYDHSGITISSSWSGQHVDQWDSGTIGIAYMTKADILKEWGGKRLSAALKEKAQKIVQGEIETYDHYLTGNVYDYRLNDEDDDMLDSCSSYFGDPKDSGAIDEAVSMIKWHVENNQKKRIARYQKHFKVLKYQIKQKVPVRYRTPFSH